MLARQVGCDSLSDLDAEEVNNFIGGQQVELTNEDLKGRIKSFTKEEDGAKEEISNWILEKIW